jgi:hypothetical protein
MMEDGGGGDKEILPLKMEDKIVSPEHTLKGIRIFFSWFWFDLENLFVSLNIVAAILSMVYGSPVANSPNNWAAIVG